MGGGGGDFFYKNRSFHFSGGGSCMSPSCVPVHEEYSRVNGNIKDMPTAEAGGARTGRDRAAIRRRVRKILKKIIMNEGQKKACKYQYDAISYAQNFDEGHHDE